MMEIGFAIFAVIVILLAGIKGVGTGKQGIRDIGEIGLYVLLGMGILMALAVIAVFIRVMK